MEVEYLYFMLGRTYDAMGDFPKARDAYLAGKDTLPFNVRSPGAINDFIRSKAETNEALIVDAETAFAEATPDGIADGRLFYDHCHPRPIGHKIIALLLQQVIERHAGLPTPDTIQRERAAIADSLKDAPAVYLCPECTCPIPSQ